MSREALIRKLCLGRSLRPTHQPSLRASALLLVLMGAAAGCVDGGDPSVAALATSSVDESAGTGAAAASGAGQTFAPGDELIALESPPVVDGALIDAAKVDLAPTLPPPARPRKRMNIDQLDLALRRASGGIGWTTTSGTNELTTLALTLGKPNYTDVTAEDLEPSALFQKFLADAGNVICTKIVSKDIAAAKADRVLLTDVEPKDTILSNPAGVDATLRHALLRFHGRVVPADAAELQTWRFLFEGATNVTGKSTEGWRAVCAAMIQHPAFTTY